MGGGWVDTILTWLFIFIGVIMTFFILLQEGKGGGLAALGGTKAAGVEGVTNPIRRATAYLAGLFFILAIILGIMHKPKEGISIGSEPTADATAGAKKDETKKPDEAKKPEPEKKADALKTDDKKPVEGAKTDDKKPAEGAKTEDKKPAEGTKTEDKKPADAPKTDAAKPAETPKADAPKTDPAKPAEEPKK